MPIIVFAAGMRESGRDSIVDMVLRGSRNNLQKHSHVRLNDTKIRKIKGMISSDLERARDEFYHGIEGEVSSRLKTGTNIIVDGPLTLKTEDGYLPLVPKEFFESFEPDVFVVFEVKKERSAPDIDWTQQEVNRSYAEMYASLAGSPLKIIKVGKGEVKVALREFTKVMESFLGK
jgi:adenylate kinase